jgi:hypothetical protein
MAASARGVYVGSDDMMRPLCVRTTCTEFSIVPYAFTYVRQSVSRCYFGSGTSGFGHFSQCGG